MSNSAEKRSAPWVGALELLSRSAPTLEETSLLNGMARGAIDATLVIEDAAEPKEAVMSLYVTDASVRLSRILPILHGLGTEVIDQYPIDLVRADGTTGRIYRFRLEFLHLSARLSLEARFIDALLAVWRGDAESDGLNALVVEAGLTWQETSVVRAYARYLRQTQLPYSSERIESVLRGNSTIAAKLVSLFRQRHDPALPDAERTAVCAGIMEDIERAVEEVVSLDADRILRAYQDLVLHTSRTNFYTQSAPALAFKLAPKNLSFLPQPRPEFEVFVYSPSVEGVHLRFGSVARGGLRWSDRPEDFRTEILGLAKAQAVKNAVIIPVGAKGGFVVKRPPVPSGDPAADRAQSRAEGVACYRSFIGSLLSITDNRELGTGKIVSPANVVCHDNPDPYLVVAADKGTATFSDIANAIALENGFWLGDAFASGGSAGYDHKAMGITARGAWESVKRHFREVGVDVQAQDFSVAGIGDMSGDVFGNGMLLSSHIRLVAAFDHRHIFLDPNPENFASYAERERLFKLAGSSWADYSRKLISTGGGVYSRAAKAVPISAEVRDRLGFEDVITSLAPDALIQRILRAPVDLLWNGGVGTYVKASREDHLTVGDKANDNVRVDAAQLRCTVVGEGGNLGFTQRARIEFAERGGRINTDALDNSAGVDCSDHEVNIKLLLQQLVSAGTMSLEERNHLLESMTQEVADKVVANNRRQNETLGMNRTNASRVAQMHLRHINVLAGAGRLDRQLEALPTTEELAQRPESARALTSPELATLLAHIKLTLKSELLTDDLIDDPFFETVLLSYFPQPLVSRFAAAISSHPLRREIIATVAANQTVDRGGLTYVHRLSEDIGARGPDAVRAYYIAASVFQLHDVWQRVRDARLDTQLEDLLFIESSRLLDHTARWLLVQRPVASPIADEINHFAANVAVLRSKVTGWLHDEDRRLLSSRSEKVIAQGVPRELAEEIFGMLDLFGLLDIIEVAQLSGHPAEHVGETYYAIRDNLGINYLLHAVTGLDRTDRWNALARMAVREDLYASARTVTLDVVRRSRPEASPEQRLQDWHQHNAPRLRQAQGALKDILASEALDLARLSVAARQIRSLVSGPNAGAERIQA